MVTLGCSFLVQSDWTTGSKNDEAGVAAGAEPRAKSGGKRRSSRRPARRGERAESCEGGVMVATSPLAAKVGLWDTAAGGKTTTLAPRRNFDFYFYLFIYFFISTPASKEKKKKEDFKIGFFFSPTLNSGGTLIPEAGEKATEGLFLKKIGRA